MYLPHSGLSHPLTYSRQVRPVYLTIPTNLVDQKIPSIPLSHCIPPNEPAVEKFVVDKIAKLAEAAQSGSGKDSIVILVDACAIQHHVRDEVRDLCEKTGFPVYAVPMGKTAISEECGRYGGVCNFPPLLSRRCQC